MASAECEPMTEVWGSRADPLVGVPEAKRLLSIFIQKRGQKLRI